MTLFQNAGEMVARGTDVLLCNDYSILIPPSPGVYFDCCVRQIKFVDFCGKYRLPLMHYLCSPECSSPCSSASHSSTSQSESDSEDEISVAAHRMQKVLLGWTECRVEWNTKRLSENRWLGKENRHWSSLETLSSILNVHERVRDDVKDFMFHPPIQQEWVQCHVWVFFKCNSLWTAVSNLPACLHFSLKFCVPRTAA